MGEVGIYVNRWCRELVTNQTRAPKKEITFYLAQLFVCFYVSNKGMRYTKLFKTIWNYCLMIHCY